MDLLIVGAGRMGRWFARTCGGESVAFADRDPAVAEAAAEEVGGRAVALEGDEGFDVVCIAVPMSGAADAIAEHATRGRSAVVDVTGAMGPAVEAMREAAPYRERLSLHPLFAPERAPGNVAAVFDKRGPVTGRIRGSLVAAGNRVVETDPETHDRAMETVQAKAHAAILAFALAADPVPEGFVTPVLDAMAGLTEAVTGGDPGVYAEIQDAFDGADEVAGAARRVAEAADDPAAFVALHDEVGPVIEPDDTAGRADEGAPASGDEASTTEDPDDGTDEASATEDPDDGTDEASATGDAGDGAGDPQ